jgi:hypothetical protein
MNEIIIGIYKYIKHILNIASYCSLGVIRSTIRNYIYDHNHVGQLIWFKNMIIHIER